MIILTVQVANAQYPEEEIIAVVNRLFDGMRAGDSTMVRSVFHPDARLMTAAARAGEPVLITGNIDAFVRAVGTPHEEVWDERVWGVDVHVEGGLATVWMDYAFYLDDQFSHCGVDAFHFFKGASGWQIIQLTDTRRKEGCEMPPDR